MVPASFFDLESLRFLCAETILGGGGVIELESLLPLRPLSPLPLLDVPYECDVESLLPLLLDSPLPLRFEFGLKTVVVVSLLHSFATSDRKSDNAFVAESLLDLEPIERMPESALDSLRFLVVVIEGVGPCSVVVCRPHGKERARSASVSRRHSCFCCFFDEPLQSRKMSVSWARELRLRRVPPKKIYGLIN